MSVRRYDRATGNEAEPLTIEQAVAVLAKWAGKSTSRKWKQAMREDLLAGIQHATAGYVYVPDADPVATETAP